MEKVLRQLFLMIFGIVPMVLFSQNLPTGLEISKNGNNYSIEFTLPDYAFDTINVIKPEGTIESFVKFSINEDFGIIDSVGLPQLPHLTFMFAIPYESNTPDIINQIVKEEEQFLLNRLYPFQEPFSTDNEDIQTPFIINENYYNSMGLYYDAVKVTDEFIVAGVKGIRITICPFVYNPSENKIIVRTHLAFEIHLESQVTAKCAESSVLESFFASLFVNDIPLQKSITKGNYLIVTAPEYENIITCFANYKRNIGYNVTVISTNIIGNSKENIKDYIQTKYNDIATRPIFVLLVGDTDKIPCWIGEHNKQPRTDLYYATLEGNDRIPDVFLGRFSISSESELNNIINKTIYMETNLHNIEKKAVFLADDDTHHYTEAGHNSVINNAFELSNYTCLKLYANDGANSSDAINAINDNQVFMLYSGHGNYQTIAEPKISINDIENLLTNTVYPFGFSFACKTNKFEEVECFGEAWIRRKHGGVAYYGASHITFYHVDYPFEKKIFNEAWYNNNEKQLGPIIKVGMEKLCNNLWSINYRKKYREMFNLMGDPSLIMTGIGCMNDYVFMNDEVFHSGNVITYHAANNITNNANFIVESGANITLKAGNSIVLKSGFHAKSGSIFHAYVEPCNSSKNTKFSTNQDIKNTIYENDVKLISENTYKKNVQIYPNPFTSQTSIEYTLQETSYVSIEIYDLMGRQILIENINNKGQGRHIYNLSGINFQNGIYIVKVQTKEYEEVLFIYKQIN